MCRVELGSSEALTEVSQNSGLDPGTGKLDPISGRGSPHQPDLMTGKAAPSILAGGPSCMLPFSLWVSLLKLNRGEKGYPHVKRLRGPKTLNPIKAREPRGIPEP